MQLSILGEAKRLEKITKLSDVLEMLNAGGKVGNIHADTGAGNPANQK